MSALSVTRDRPIFSGSRRPPAPPAPPMPVAEAPPPPPAAPEQPPLTLVGTAIGKPQNVALILNQTTRTLVRLHVGEEAAGWYLRSVDARTMTLEKASQQVTLSLPVPGALPANPQPVALAGQISRSSEAEPSMTFPAPMLSAHANGADPLARMRHAARYDPGS